MGYETATYSRNLMHLTSDYEYVLGSFGRNLEIAMTESKNRFVYEDFDAIGQTGVQIAQAYVDRYYSGTLKRHTGKLRDSITYEVKGNQSVTWKNNAMDERGKYYGGHIEYGFRHNNSGLFLGPWPYLRPMLLEMQKITGSKVMADEVEFLQTFLTTGQKTRIYMGTNINPKCAGSGTRQIINKNMANRGGYSGKNVRGYHPKYTHFIATKKRS